MAPHWLRNLAPIVGAGISKGHAKGVWRQKQRCPAGWSQSVHSASFANGSAEIAPQLTRWPAHCKSSIVVPAPAGRVPPFASCGSSSRVSLGIGTGRSRHSSGPNSTTSGVTVWSGFGLLHRRQRLTRGLARRAAAAAQQARHCPNSPSLYERERWNSLAGLFCSAQQNTESARIAGGKTDDTWVSC